MNYQEKYLKYKKKYLKLKKKMVGGTIINKDNLPLIFKRVQERIDKINEHVLQNNLLIKKAIHTGQDPPIAEFDIIPHLKFDMNKNWANILYIYIKNNYIKFFTKNLEGKDFREHFNLQKNRLLLLMRTSGITSAKFLNQQIIVFDYENYFIRYKASLLQRVSDLGALENLIIKLGKLDNHINIICKREATMNAFDNMKEKLKQKNYSVSCIFTETFNGFEKKIYPKSTRSFDDCTFVLIFKYLFPIFPNTIYFSDDKKLFNDFNSERKLLLPYNITIKASLDDNIIDKAIINPIEDDFYNTDLTPTQLADYNDPIRGFSNIGLI